MKSKNGSFEKNLKLQEKEIKENKVILKSFPTKLGILFGNQCNLKCKMCGNQGMLTRMGLKKATCFRKNTLENLINLFPYLKSLVLSGGEPLVYNECRNILEIAKKYPNLKLKIMTNGTLIDDYWIDQFCKLPFREIAISIDAATQKTYKNIRVGGNLDKVLKAIKRINDRKNGDEPKISISYIIMRRNFDETLKFMDLAHKYNVSTVAYRTIADQRQFFYMKEKVTAKKEECFELLKICDKIDDLADDYNIDIVNRIPCNIFLDNTDAFLEYYGAKENDLNNSGKLDCYTYWKNVDVSPTYVNNCPGFVTQKNASLFFYPNDPSKMNGFWNNDIFVNIRKMFLDRQYDKLCTRSCPPYFLYKTKGIIG